MLEKKQQFLKCLGSKVISISNISNRISSSTAHGSEEFYGFMWLMRDNILWWQCCVCVCVCVYASRV